MKHRCTSPVESLECNTEWSSEDILSPTSTCQLELDSTPDHSSIPSKVSQKDYSDSLLGGITDSPSYYITSPLPSENSHPDAIICEEGGIDLYNNDMYFENFNLYQQDVQCQQQLLSESYDLQDCVQQLHIYEQYDLFSNDMNKSMVTIDMNKLQPKQKPHAEEEKHSEFEDTDLDNNMSGVVEGICTKLENDIVNETENCDKIEVPSLLKEEITTTPIYNQIQDNLETNFQVEKVTQPLPKEQKLPTKEVIPSGSKILDVPSKPDKIKTPEPIKKEIVPLKENKNIHSRAEELFDTLVHSSNPLVYTQRQAFTDAKKKIQEEYKSSSRKRKRDIPNERPVKLTKRTDSPDAGYHSVRDYKLQPVEIDAKPKVSSCRTPNLVYRPTPTLYANSDTSRDDSWREQPHLKDLVERLGAMKYSGMIPSTKKSDLSDK